MMLLKCDSEFSRLKPGLDLAARNRLTDSIRLYGCREPLIVWDQTIIDGYKRYEICTTFGLRYDTQQIQLRFREDAVIWICDDLLGKNMNDERKKYLIGKLFDSYQMRNSRPGMAPPPKPGSGKPAIAAPISDELCRKFKVGQTTLGKYKRYAHMLDRIYNLHSGFGAKLMDGRIQSSHERIIEIGEMSDSQILTLAREVEITGETRITSRDLTRLLRQANSRAMFFHQISAPPPVREAIPIPLPSAQSISAPKSIKEMPQHDPDSAVNSLCLTVPSWRYSINRVRENKEYPFMVSEDAKARLRSELLELKHLVNICVREMQI